LTARAVFHIIFERIPEFADVPTPLALATARPPGGGFMARLKDLLRKTEFHLFLFCLFFLLFNWPLLTLIEKTRPPAGFLYLYAAWSALVVVLAIIAHHCRPSSTGSADQEKPRQ
jgi:hypothetical protein